MEEFAAEATFVRSFSSDFASRCWEWTVDGGWMLGCAKVASLARLEWVNSRDRPGGPKNEEMIWGFTGFQKGGQSSQVKDPETGPKIFPETRQKQ